MLTSPRPDLSVSDRRIQSIVPLISPALLAHELPLTPDRAQRVVDGRASVSRVLAHEDDRLLVVVGPCSIHDVDAAREYAERLRAEAERHADSLLVVMRVYFEKPRSTVGWKGLINDPHLDGSGDVNAGMRLARALLLDVVDLGLPTACEFLDPITTQYIADTVSWGAIGARTVESQVHRQLASGLSMPIGMKNRADGSLETAVDALHAAAATHVFAGIDVSGTPSIFHTRGNPECHVVLRGGKDQPNYGAEHVSGALELLRSAGLPERVVIDASHDNSGKDHVQQRVVVDDIAAQVAAGQAGIVGVMMESFLQAGRQNLQGERPLTYGQSITDACMDWTTTVSALERLAEATAARRGGR